MHQGRPNRDELGVVHLEDGDRRPADPRPADEARTFPAEVAAPSVPPWVVQTHDLARLGIDARQVRALEAIAVKARHRQVLGESRTAVLPGDDVVDLERRGGDVLGLLAILATPLRSLPDEPLQRRVHQEGSLSTCWSDNRARDQSRSSRWPT